MPDCLAGAVGVRVRVGIDPGHGGKSTGCVGGDLREASYVYDAAEALALELLRRGHTFALSRRRDECRLFHSRCLGRITSRATRFACGCARQLECGYHPFQLLSLCG